MRWSYQILSNIWMQYVTGSNYYRRLSAPRKVWKISLKHTIMQKSNKSHNFTIFTAASLPICNVISVTKLSASYSGIIGIEVVTAYCTPWSAVVDFQATRITISNETNVSIISWRNNKKICILNPLLPKLFV